MKLKMNWLYPRHCPLCDTLLGKEEPLVCRQCGKNVPLIRGPVCMRCGRPLRPSSGYGQTGHPVPVSGLQIQEDMDAPEYCADCRQRKHRIEEGIAPFAYSREVQMSVLRMKYGGRAEYAGFYAAAIWRTGASRIRSWDPDVIIPVPVHIKRELKRGYNQAEEIAEALSKLTGIPVRQPVQRVKQTRPQKGLTPSERLRNVRGAFLVPGGQIMWRKILIVDDIYTTGSTLDEMAAVLAGAGGRRFWSACASVSPGPV